MSSKILEEFKIDIEKHLEKTLSQSSYINFFHEVYKYSLLPAGKLFRPLLCLAVAKDTKNSLDNNIFYLSSFVEMHHTYTLMHDDLPAMDDDDSRRGRAASHIRFNEWSALLAGDGLLNASYRCFAKIDSSLTLKLLDYASWALGPKGLILGQALDLSESMNESINNLVLTHRLKTARLIQVCLTVSRALSHPNPSLKDLKEFHRLGDDLGIAFQFLDDLSELSEKELTKHEKEVNPWVHSPQISQEILCKSLERIGDFFQKNKMEVLNEVIENYLKKMRTHITESSDIIKNHVRIDLNPTISRLN